MQPKFNYLQPKNKYEMQKHVPFDSTIPASRKSTISTLNYSAIQLRLIFWGGGTLWKGKKIPAASVLNIYTAV